MKKEINAQNSKLDKIYELCLHSYEEVKIIKKMQIKNKDVTEDDSLCQISLPLKTLQQFNEVDDKLVGDAQFKKSLVRKLSAFGGNTLSNVVHFMMNGLLDKNLAVQFSLQGKTKNKFRSTNIFSCILGEFNTLFKFNM